MSDKTKSWTLKSVDIHSSVAVYVQIEDAVRAGIVSGKLKESDQLPSVRELSERLDVNLNTVAKSYRDLEVMGMVYSRRGMGVYIKKGARPIADKYITSEIKARAAELGALAADSGKTALMEQVLAKAIK